MPGDLSGRAFLVTGGNTGIGLASQELARRLAGTGVTRPASPRATPELGQTLWEQSEAWLRA
jgi:NAD(P)-dependent dehydrogenase (short-subunit alcohol dehydrogenase family)